MDITTSSKNAINFRMVLFCFNISSQLMIAYGYPKTGNGNHVQKYHFLQQSGRKRLEMRISI